MNKNLRAMALVTLAAGAGACGAARRVGYTPTYYYSNSAYYPQPVMTVQQPPTVVYQQPPAVVIQQPPVYTQPRVIYQQPGYYYGPTGYYHRPWVQGHLNVHIGP